MTTTRIAHPAHPATPESTERTPEHILRGHGLFELHRDEILESYLGAGRWIVPSGSVEGRTYEARVGSRPERSRCECRGFASHKHCSHIVCATLARKKSFTCDGCGRRTPNREMVVVGDDSLSLFEGDQVCGECALAHGVL